jgi:D-alanine-D-alanine ligase-like ATP-grasp enzyme
MNGETILPEGRKYVLHPVANTGSGGESIDVTDIVHPEFAEIAVRACHSVPGMIHAGIDIIAQDISMPAKAQRYTVIETNTMPDIALHHFPVHGIPRDAARALLECLFM